MMPKPCQLVPQVAPTSAVPQHSGIADFSVVYHCCLCGLEIQEGAWQDWFCLSLPIRTLIPLKRTYRDIFGNWWIVRSHRGACAVVWERACIVHKRG